MIVSTHVNIVSSEVEPFLTLKYIAWHLESSIVSELRQLFADVLFVDLTTSTKPPSSIAARPRVSQPSRIFLRRHVCSGSARSLAQVAKPAHEANRSIRRSWRRSAQGRPRRCCWSRTFGRWSSIGKQCALQRYVHMSGRLEFWFDVWDTMDCMLTTPS